MTDLYFRKQNMLMRNAILPAHEIAKMNQKHAFQSKHVEMLSIPKQQRVREKVCLDDTSGISDRTLKFTKKSDSGHYPNLHSHTFQATARSQVSKFKNLKKSVSTTYHTPQQ
jgi:hypothetical protein